MLSKRLISTKHNEQHRWELMSTNTPSDNPAFMGLGNMDLAGIVAYLRKNPIVVGPAGGDLQGNYPFPTLKTGIVTAGTTSYPSSVTVDDKGRVTNVAPTVSYASAVMAANTAWTGGVVATVCSLALTSGTWAIVGSAGIGQGNAVSNDCSAWFGPNTGTTNAFTSTNCRAGLATGAQVYAVMNLFLIHTVVTTETVYLNVLPTLNTTLWATSNGLGGPGVTSMNAWRIA